MYLEAQIWDVVNTCLVGSVTVPQAANTQIISFCQLLRPRLMILEISVSLQVPQNENMQEKKDTNNVCSVSLKLIFLVQLTRSLCATVISTLQWNSLLCHLGPGSAPGPFGGVCQVSPQVPSVKKTPEHYFVACQTWSTSCNVNALTLVSNSLTLIPNVSDSLDGSPNIDSKTTAMSWRCQWLFLFNNFYSRYKAVLRVEGNPSFLPPPQIFGEIK